MNLNYTPEALADLETIYNYISYQAHPGTAGRVRTRILQALTILENFPLIGRPGRVPDTREFSIGKLPYVAVYRIVDETDISVVAIVHTSRNFP